MAGTALLAGPRLRAAPGLPPLQRWGEHTWWVAGAPGDPSPANGGATANLLLAREGSRVWLVGSGPTRPYGEALARAVREAVGAPVSDIVITRPAPELSMASAAFGEARIWALPDVAAAMRERCADCQARLKLALGAAGDSLVPENIRVPDQMIGAPGAPEGELGPFTWRALPRGGGERALALRHRDDAIVLAQGFVWAGDLPDLRATRQPAFTDSLHLLRSWTGRDRLLGEQGGPCTAAEIDRHLAYLQELRQALLPRILHGDTWPGTSPGDPLRHAFNVQHLWLELEDQSLR